MASLAELLSIHRHIHENIKFADQKAILIVSIDGGLMGAIYQVMQNAITPSRASQR